MLLGMGSVIKSFPSLVPPPGNTVSFEVAQLGRPYLLIVQCSASCVYTSLDNLPESADPGACTCTV